MSRDKYIPKRGILPDEKYNSIMVSTFINVMMKDEKKSIARKNLYIALQSLEEKSKIPALEAFDKAINNIRPLIEVKSRRVGGANYQIPIEVTDARGKALAIRWVIMFARKRSEKTFALRLAGELMDSLNQTGNSYKKKEDTHKMAEANKAFAFFRW
jgi:small subunit ribosomal protein S7